MKPVTLGLLAALAGQPVLADPLIEDFPYPLIAVDGAQAFAEWQALRGDPGTPIILGDREQVERILGLFDPDHIFDFEPRETVLAKAEAMQHPASLYEHRVAEHAYFVKRLQDRGSDWAEEMAETDPLDIPEEYWGAWPEFITPADGPISLVDWETGGPPDTVFITVLPTEQPWQAPAYLRFGGWNANPPPELHAAAFRAWADTYGAVPVVMQSDVIEMFVETPPVGRDAAQALAREHYIYAADIVDQGVGEVNVLAALLAEGQFWYFWWD